VKETIKDLLPAERIQEQGIRLLGTTMSNFLIEEKKPVKQIEIDFGSDGSS
jgi:hypothetical protein